MDVSDPTKDGDGDGKLAPEEIAEGASPAVLARVERFGGGGSVAFELLRSEFLSTLCQRSSKFCSHSVGIRQKSSTIHFR